MPIRHTLAAIAVVISVSVSPTASSQSLCPVGGDPCPEHAEVVPGSENTLSDGTVTVRCRCCAGFYDVLDKQQCVSRDTAIGILEEELARANQLVEVSGVIVENAHSEFWSHARNKGAIGLSEDVFAAGTPLFAAWYAGTINPQTLTAAVVGLAMAESKKFLDFIINKLYCNFDDDDEMENLCIAWRKAASVHASNRANTVEIGFKLFELRKPLQ